MHYYPGFNAQRPAGTPNSAAHLAGDIKHCLTRPTGFEAVMRVRASKGVDIRHFYGHFYLRGKDLLALPNVHSDSSFAVAFEPRAEVTSPYAYFQSALLYTTSEGQRRIRVLTKAVPCTTYSLDVYNRASVDTTTNLMLRMACDAAEARGVRRARQQGDAQCVDVARTYRQQTMQSSGGYGGSAMGMAAYGAAAAAGAYGRGGAAMPGMPGRGMMPGMQGHQQMQMQQQQQQMQQQQQQQQGGDIVSLPDSLKLLPLYTMALAKSGVLRGNLTTFDQRNFLLSTCRPMPVHVSRVFLYPRMFAIHAMSQEHGKVINENKIVAANNGAAAGVNANNGAPPSPGEETLADGRRVQMPPSESLTAATLTSNGAFLLDQGICMTIWLGRQCNPALVRSLVGAEMAGQLDNVSEEALSLQRVPGDALNDRVGAAPFFFFFSFFLSFFLFFSFFDPTIT